MEEWKVADIIRFAAAGKLELVTTSGPARRNGGSSCHRFAANGKLTPRRPVEFNTRPRIVEPSARRQWEAW